MSRKLWALLGALILIAGLGFLTWPANAGTGGNSYYTWAWTVTPTRCADKGQANGAAQVVFTNTSSRQYYADMTVPIDVVAIGDVSPGQTVTETVDSRQAPDGLPAGTSYWALYIEDGQVDAQQVTIAQCPVIPPIKVRPKATKFRDKHGTKHDVYIIPATKGVSYTHHGKVVKAGRHHAKGKVTVKAVAKHGYTLIGKTVWSHRFKR